MLRHDIEARRLAFSSAVLICLLLTALPARCAPPEPLRIGLAELDVTPARPVHLINQLKPKESEGVHHPLRAKALAFVGEGAMDTAILIVFDGIGVPPQLTEQLRRRLSPKIAPDNLTICATHDHCAPHLTGLLPGIFGDPLPEEHLRRINEYTRELTAKLETAARLALSDAKPRRLFKGRGKVSFAVNRRRVENGKWLGWGNNPDGAVDHNLPLLCIRELDGTAAAILVSYACHNTSIGGRDFDNRISGDWVGYAQSAIEINHPGALAFVALGCGGEARPNKHGGIDAAREFSSIISKEVTRVLDSGLRPISSPPNCQWATIPLSLGPPPEPDELRSISTGAPSAKSRSAKARGRLASQALASAAPLELSLPYQVQTWSFGKELSWVFLAGEVVVDYAHRIKRELGPTAWTIAYANDLPCYIPSKRILSEGGYEADQSMAYYGKLQSLLPSTEERIIAEVKRQLSAAR